LQCELSSTAADIEGAQTRQIAGQFEDQLPISAVRHWAIGLTALHALLRNRSLNNYTVGVFSGLIQVKARSVLFPA